MHTTRTLFHARHRHAILWCVSLLLSLWLPLVAGRAAWAQNVVREISPGPGLPAIPLTGTETPPNDDDWFGPIELGFTIKFGDRFYTQIYISNNGFVIFEAPRYKHWAYYWSWDNNVILTPGVATDGRRAVIAPFLWDVDTRAPGSGRMSYGKFMWPNGYPAFFVTWDHVGYFDKHDDLLNTFQLILTDISHDPGNGDGDFQIMMNYDSINWAMDWGYNPRVGYYDGAGTTVELPGSRTEFDLLDSSPDGLIHQSNGTPTLGSYVYAIRNSLTSDQRVITGTVTGLGRPLQGAQVFLLDGNGEPVAIGTTNRDGVYFLTQIDASIGNGPWQLVVNGPDTPLLMQHYQDLYDLGVDPILHIDVTLEPYQYTPPYTTIGSGTWVNSNGIPVLYWGNQTPLVTSGCVGGMATYSVQSAQGVVLGPVPMTADLPPGQVMDVYRATMPALRPTHGNVTLVIEIGDCPDGSAPTTQNINIYIDPSGAVRTTRGAALADATVTLYRSDTPYGPFRVVPNGSAIMSPTNRNNPSYTDTAGHFGWDTVPGYYIVRAEKEGCVSPANADIAFVETPVLPVPPPQLDLGLTLDCDGTTPPVITVPSHLTVEAEGPDGAVVDYTASALDDIDGVVAVSCAPASGSVFALGQTTVLCMSMDVKGNLAMASFTIEVRDTRPPVLTVPEEVTVWASDVEGEVVPYTVTANDLVSGAVVADCQPASGSLFAVGSTEVACTAMDASGNTAHATFPVHVVYAWTGLLEPVQDGASYHLGRTVPVKFRLDGASVAVPGVQAALYLASVSLSGALGSEVPAVASGNANTGNLFRYDPASQQYIFNWSTKGLRRGWYRLRVDLGDGLLRAVMIHLVA